MGFMSLFGGDIITAATGAFGKVLDKFAGDKISESELEKIKLEGEIELNKSLRDSEVSFNDRVKMEMSTKVNPIVDTIRGLVRPTITAAFSGLYFYVKYNILVALNKAYEAAIAAATTPQEHIEAAREFAINAFTMFDFMCLITILTFWFGGKLLERYVEKMTTLMEANPIAAKNPGWLFKVANKLFK